MDYNENALIANMKKYYRKYGFGMCLCIFAIVILIIISLCILWHVKTNVCIEPIGSYISTIEDDKEIPIIKKQSVSGQYSAVGMIEEMFSGINDTTQAVELAKNISGLYSSSKTDKGELLIPKGAGATELKDDTGYTELGNFSIYLWSEKGTYFLFNRDYEELHAVMIYDDKYIHVYEQFQLLSFNVVTEVGELQLNKN